MFGKLIFFSLISADKPHLSSPVCLVFRLTGGAEFSGGCHSLCSHSAPVCGEMEPKGIEVRQQTADENRGNCSADFYFHVYNDNIKKDTLHWLFSGCSLMKEKKKKVLPGFQENCSIFLRQTMSRRTWLVNRSLISVGKNNFANIPSIQQRHQF